MGSYALRGVSRVGMLFYEEGEGLGDRRKDTMAVKSLIEIALQLEPPDREFLEESIFEFPLDRGPG